MELFNSPISKGWKVTTINGLIYEVLGVHKIKGYLISKKPKAYLKPSKVFIAEMPNMGKIRKLK
jgi:hypothetical protein